MMTGSHSGKGVGWWCIVGGDGTVYPSSPSVAQRNKAGSNLACSPNVNQCTEKGPHVRILLIRYAIVAGK